QRARVDRDHQRRQPDVLAEGPAAAVDPGPKWNDPGRRRGTHRSVVDGPVQAGAEGVARGDTPARRIGSAAHRVDELVRIRPARDLEDLVARSGEPRRPRSQGPEVKLSGHLVEGSGGAVRAGDLETRAVHAPGVARRSVPRPAPPRYAGRLPVRRSFRRVVLHMGAPARDAGLFGPGSASWQVNRETTVLFGGARA